MIESRRIAEIQAPHAWGDPLKTRYAAQLASGLGNVLILEGVPGASADADWSGYHFADGLMDTPDAPGFGITLFDIDG